MRCPNGTRKNKKTGNCESLSNKVNKKIKKDNTNSSSKQKKLNLSLSLKIKNKPKPNLKPKSPIKMYSEEDKSYYLISILPDMLSSEKPNFKYTKLMTNEDKTVSLEEYYFIAVNYGKKIGITPSQFIESMIIYPKYLYYFLDDSNYEHYFKDIFDNLPDDRKKEFISIISKNDIHMGSLKMSMILKIYHGFIANSFDRAYLLNCLLKRLTNKPLLSTDNKKYTQLEQKEEKFKKYYGKLYEKYLIEVINA